MAKTNIRSIWYALIFAMLFLTAGISYISIFVADSPSFDEEDRFGEFSRLFDKQAELSLQINTTQSKILSSETDYGLFGALNALIKTSWEAIKNMFTSLSFVSDIFSGLSAFFGVPTWLTGFVMMLLVVTVAYTILSLIFQGDT